MHVITDECMYVYMQYVLLTYVSVKTQAPSEQDPQLAAGCVAPVTAAVLEARRGRPGNKRPVNSGPCLAVF